MRGLLLKDLLNLKQLLRTCLLVVAVWIVAGIAKHDSAYIGGLLTMLVIMVPFNAVAYDEGSKWDSYALALPITRRDMVLSKYALMLLCALASSLIFLLSGLLLGESFIPLLGMSLTFAGVGLCMTCVLLPLLFQFGVQKARVIMLLFIMVPVLAALLPGSEVIVASFFTTVFGQGQLWLLAPITFGLFASSYMLSLYIYNRKAF